MQSDDSWGQNPNDTIIYFSTEGLNQPAMELPTEFDDRPLLEAFVEGTADFDMGDGFTLAGTAMEMSTEALKLRAAAVLLESQSNPKFKEMLENADRWEYISARWKLKAAANPAGNGYAVHKLYADAAHEQIVSGRALMESAESSDDLWQGAAKVTNGVGKTIGLLGDILSVSKGLYTGIADDTFKGIYSTLSGIAAGMVAGLAVAAVGVLVGPEILLGVVFVAFVSYWASEFSEDIWDMSVGPQFWGWLDSQGLGEAPRQFFKDFARDVFGREIEDPSNLPLIVKNTGEFDLLPERLVAYGTSGNDNFYISGGRTVILGGAGYDTYNYLTAELEGVQTIMDDDGFGKVVMDNIDVGAAPKERLSESVWRSLDGQFLYTLTAIDGRDQVVIQSLQTGKSVVVTDWSTADLGIILDGYVQPGTELNPLTSEDDLFGVSGDLARGAGTTSTNSGDDAIQGLGGNDGLSGGAGDDILDGGDGSDLIFGGSGDDTIYGGNGDDVIMDGSETVSFREWRTEPEVGGQSEAEYMEDHILSLGSNLRFRGKSWYVYNSPASGGIVVGTPESNFAVDPNLSPSGNDVIDAGAGADLVFSGEGDDVVLGGTGGDFLVGGHDNDILMGGDDDDTLLGDVSDDAVPGQDFTALVSSQAKENGNDILDGGAGNDLVAGGGGDDVIYGGTGNDVLHGFGYAREADTDDTDSDYIEGGGGDDQIFGEDGDDRLFGGSGNDYIRGDGEQNVRHGSDYIDAGDGDDQVSGDGGSDTLLGGDGNDLLIGDGIGLAASLQGDDEIHGGKGDDELQGGGGNDRLFGGDDEDVLLGEAGADHLDGGRGDDQLAGGDGNDYVIGGEGNDQAWGGGGRDVIYGGAGNDTLAGEEGNDSLYGEAGDDILVGAAGSDTLLGGAGNDVLDAGDGNDLLSGEAGDDTLDGDAGNDVMLGGEGNDQLYGGSDNDTLAGGTGNDVLNGASGNDTYQFAAGWGQDEIQGLDASDAGTDVISFAAGITPEMISVTVNTAGHLVLQRIGSTDTIVVRNFFNNTNAEHRIEFADGTQWTMTQLTERFRDSFGDAYGDQAANILVGGSSLEYINGGLGDDILVGGSANNQMYGGATDGSYPSKSDNDFMYGGDGQDTMYGEEGNDLLDGGNGNDTLTGGYGGDILYGGAGNDILQGGWWRSFGGTVIADTYGDYLDGGAGNDALVGGLGNNVYYFGPGSGLDTIGLTQVDPTQAVSGVPSESALLRFAASINASALVFTRNGNDLIIQYGTDQVTLLNFGGRGDVQVNFQFLDGSNLSPAQIAVMATWDGSDAPEKLSGGSGDDTLHGYRGDDELFGNAGNDVLIGGLGRDRLNGGAGNDTYKYDLADGVDEIVGSATGTDTLEFGAGITQSDLVFYKTIPFSGYTDCTLYILVASTGNYIKVDWKDGQTDQHVDLIRFADGSTLTKAQIEAAVVSEPPSFALTPTSGSSQYANDVSGPTGGDYVPMAGGKGDDIYRQIRTYNELGIPTELANEGEDTVVTNFNSYILPANIENLVVQFSTQVNGIRNFTGNELSNIIDVSQSSTSQVHRLDGGAGADILIGGRSNDIFVIDDAGDVVIESVENGSIDTIETRFSYSLGVVSPFENITLTGSDNTTATGNAGNNVLDSSLSTGINTLAGGVGNDTYYVNIDDVVVENAGEGTDWVFYRNAAWNAAATLAQGVENGSIEGTGIRELTGNALNNELRGTAWDNVINGGDGNDVVRGQGGLDELYGGNGNDQLFGGVDHDVLDGGSGDDVMQGGQDSDTYYVDSAGDTIIELAWGGLGDKVVSTINYTLGAELEQLELAGTAVYGAGNAGYNFLVGNALDNQLYGFAAGDMIYGGDGNDLLVGGDDTDELYGESGNDTLEGEAGTDRLYGGEGNDTLSGGSENDSLYASTGNDILDGGQGEDYLAGDAGSDTYVWGLGDGVDIFSEGENVTGEVDVLRFKQGISVTDVVLKTSVRNQTYWVEVGGIRLDLGSSLAGIEQIQFHDGTVWQVDQMATIANDDPYLQQNPIATIFRGHAFSQDLSQLFFDETAMTLSMSGLPAWLSYNPATGILSGQVPSDAQDLSFEITGTDTGGAQVTTTFQLSAIAAIDGTANADTLIGTAGIDALFGYAGNDSLDGRASTDYMYGGLGNDTYYVDIGSESEGTDQVIELAGEGDDLVNSSASYILTDNVERLTLTGSFDISGVGNSLDNTLTGNNADNVLNGMAGNDTLLGNNGGDGLYGGEGNDTLNGGSGSDYMEGGVGDDTYVVGSTGDYVAEFENEGIDTVQASIAYTLDTDVENLLITGTSNLAGYGNAQDNVLTGNSGANSLYGYGGNDTLDGGTGNDTMVGGQGNDTYVVNVSGDVVTELAGEGTDTVRAGITYTLGSTLENLVLTGTTAINGTGNAANNLLTGNSGANSLSGLGGDDVLDGQGGADTLTGAAGNDTYLMARTYGTDTVVDTDTTAGNNDVARFLTGVSYDQLWFRRPASSNNLEITIIGTTDKLIIKDWYLGDQYKVEEIRVDDGSKMLTKANVQALVTAMAGMTMPGTGQTTLTTAQRNTLNPVFATTWQDQPAGLMKTSSQPALLGETRPTLWRDPPRPAVTGGSQTHLRGQDGDTEFTGLLHRGDWKRQASMSSELDALVSAMAGFGPAEASLATHVPDLEVRSIKLVAPVV